MPQRRADTLPPDDVPEDAARVLRKFRVVFNAVKRHFQQVERVAGIGGAQVWALSIVEQAPGLGVGDIARAMDIHQTTASNLVKALVGSGLLDVQRTAEDRRRTCLVLTEAGRTVLSRTPGPFAGVLPQALSSLDPAVLKRLDADLAVLVEALRGDARAEGIPLAQL